MPRRNAIATALVSLSMAFGLAATALGQQAAPERTYSATAIHSIPGQPETSGRVIKSGENMRLEFEQNGQKIVQILLPQQGVMYVLEPNSKTYMEMRGQAVPTTAGSGADAPCTPQSNLALCERVGSDTVSGIRVERWLLAAQPQTKPLTVLWDPTRRQALRQDFPDGSSVAMSFKAMEKLNGRRVEHWIIQTLAPGRDTLTGGWWYDPELRVVVREELPGGEVRRLENITVGAVDPSAFQVPKGWRKRDPRAIATPQAPTAPITK